MDASVEFARHLLQTVVNLHVTVPRGHPSSRILGNERMGSGIVIDAAGSRRRSTSAVRGNSPPPTTRTSRIGPESASTR